MKCLKESVFPKTRSLVGGVVLCFALLAWGCAPPPERPLSVTPGLEKRLLETLEESAGTVSSLRGLAKVRVDSGERAMRGNQVLLVERPDRFRAESLSPFGNPLMVVTTDGEKVQALIPSEGRFMEGEASYRNLVRFTGLPLELEDLLRILLYQIPPIAFDRSRIEAGSEGYLLHLAGSGLRQELLFDPELRLIRASWFERSDLLLRVDYDRFTEAPPFYPRTIDLEVPSAEIAASVNFNEIELNPDLPAERFKLSPPTGYAVEPLP